MNIIIPPEIDANKAVADAVAFGTEFFEMRPNRFQDEIVIEWGLRPSLSGLPTIVLDLRYQAKQMAQDKLPPEVWQDRKEFARRLSNMWMELLEKIGDLYSARVREMLANLDEE